MSNHEMHIDCGAHPRADQGVCGFVELAEAGRFIGLCGARTPVFEPDGISFCFPGAAQRDCVALRFVGGSKNAPTAFLKQQDGLRFGMLKYSGVWEGVDLELSANEGGLDMNWVLDAPERAGAIRLCWEGADSMGIDESGRLLIRHARGIRREEAPVAWQVAGAEFTRVGCGFQLAEGGAFRFALCDCDGDSPVVIGPAIS